jgi:hypothetical protein
VGERHGNASGGEGGHREEAAPLDVGAAQAGCGQDGIPLVRPFGIGRA